MTGRQFMIGTLVLVAMIMLLLLVKEPRHGADPIRETVTLNQYIQALETEAWTVRDITRFHVEGADFVNYVIEDRSGWTPMLEISERHPRSPDFQELKVGDHVRFWFPVQLPATYQEV